MRELGRELEQTVGQVEGVQQMLARMELEKMGLQVGQALVVVIVTKVIRSNCRVGQIKTKVISDNSNFGFHRRRQ